MDISFVNAFDRYAFSALTVDIKTNSAYTALSVRNDMRALDIIGEFINNDLFFYTEHRVYGTCHSRVGNAARSVDYALVRGLDVRVSSDNSGNPPREIPAHSVLFACCLGVKIDDYYL